MNVQPVDRKLLFDRQSCDLCGICFSECPEMELPISTAREEIALAIEGNPRYVLERCTACRVCNALCPKSCNPWGLVNTLRNGRYETSGISRVINLVAPHFTPNIFSALRGVLTEREKRVVDSWSKPPEGREEVFYSGTLSLLFPYLYDSALLDELPIISGEKLDAGVFYFVPGYMNPARDAFTPTAETLNSLGVGRIVAETEPYDMLKHNVFNNRLDFEVVHLAEWLLKRLTSGDIKISSPLNLTLTVHDNCMSRDFRHIMDEAREILSILGCKTAEMARHGERGVCCGLGGGSKAFNPVDMIAHSMERLREAENTGAQGLVVYCPGCLWMLHMARLLSGSNFPIYHIFELVRMGAGVRDLQSKHAERAWSLLGFMGDGLVSNILKTKEKRIFIDVIPGHSGPGFGSEPRAFPNTMTSSLLKRKAVRNAVSAMGPYIIAAFMASYLNLARLFFKARVRLGAVSSIFSPRFGK